MTDLAGDAATGPVRLLIQIQGVVQGVGFRPFVYRIARDRRLTGWVRNGPAGVSIAAQGSRDAAEGFLADLREHAPPRAAIARIAVERVAADPTLVEFHILESATGGQVWPSIPADLATCLDCLAEIADPRTRRYRYPFTNCTQCGPRFTIIDRLPYDRPHTAMAGFPPCPACAAEYHDPSDRRFHAQPIACPECGPALALLQPDGNVLATGDDALRQAEVSLAEGRILALKGLGGFQLLVLAGDPAAVGRLRERKRRPAKPFAVIFPSLAVVGACCEISAQEAAALASPAAPIVLVRRRADADPAAACHGVAPDNPWIGAMLPYTPLHHLLLGDLGRPLVCTSGNVSDEPICSEDTEAPARLGGIADLFLSHDRPVRRPVDDSVGRLGRGGLTLLRRARGFAPLPLAIPPDLPPVLALGGHQKATVALLQAGQIVVSQHLGDLGNSRGADLLERTARDLVRICAGRPEALACDLHPDYASTLLAGRLGAEWNLPLLPVQHHHAHVGAVLAEYGLEGAVLGLAWDGTGYGADGTIWGGEMLVADALACRRVAHLAPFPLPGGDRASRDPRRAALGLLFGALGDQAAEFARKWFPERDLAPMLQATRRGINAPLTSSMGRLFDAVAAIAGVRAEPGFEGQAAMALEFAADLADRAVAPYPLPLQAGRSGEVAPEPVRTGEPAAAPVAPQVGGSPAIADWRPLVAALLADRRAGVAPTIMAARFHLALAELGVTVARKAGLARIVLAGGCFQNRLLAALLTEQLEGAGFCVYIPERYPPNDGAIALGQAFIAASRLRREA